MKKFLFAWFVMLSCLCTAQVTDKQDNNSDTLDFDSDTIPFHYPYMGPRVPSWVGIILGYEGVQTHCWETGIIFHLPEYYDRDGRARGVIVGGAVTYKQSFSNRLKTIEAEIGAYAPVSFGFGFNENFYLGTRTFGFRPFIGTSWYHFQLLAGYNFYSKKQADIAELDHLTLKIRYAIPIRRLYVKGTPNPGNNY